MALILKGWQRGLAIGAIGSAKTRYKHYYLTDDDAAAVQTAGYFNGLADEFNIGDLIDASLDNNGTPVRKNYIVTANTGTVVTIAIQTVA